MTAASYTNLLTIVLCGSVLVQCTRMMRSIRAFRQIDLPAMVGSLEAATGQAQAILKQMRAALLEAEPKMRGLSEGQAVAEELGVMIGIANATADRLLEASRECRTPAARDLAA